MGQIQLTSLNAMLSIAGILAESCLRAFGKIESRAFVSYSSHRFVLIGDLRCALIYSY